MDGMLHLTRDTGTPTSATPSLLGILYAEDFDDPGPALSPAPPADLEPDPVPAITPADVDAACAQAVAAARLDWETAAATERLDLLAKIATSVAEIRAEAEDVALAAAEGTVATILTALMAALPKLCAEHGPDEVRALLDRLLPMLRAEPKITIRVHPDLVPGLREELADIQGEFAGNVEITAAPVARGDVKIAWHNGSCVRDTAQIHQAMHEALGQLGLLETSPTRSLCSAE